MKFPRIILLTWCAALLISCGRQNTASDTDQDDQERLAEEQQAAQLRQLHLQEAAQDEQRILAQTAQSTPAAVTTPPVSAPPPIATEPAQAPQPQEAAPSGSDATYQLFYDTLAPYGNWVQMAGYGYVWQPAATIQDFRWRPYTLGRWVYTNDGWTWASDEPFGWITYHYGRWMRTHTLGWVWFPGDEWAPGWVSWRYGADFVGWAPLPPQAAFDATTGIQQWADQAYGLGPDDYTFIPASAFGDENVADNEVPPEENGPIFENSDNETNIYYDQVTYVIVCYGPNYDFMRSKARHPLSPPLTITRGDFHPGGNNRPFLSGSNLRVSAPRIVAPRTPIGPRIIHSTVTDSRIVSAPVQETPRGSAPEPPAAIYHPTQTATLPETTPVYRADQNNTPQPPAPPISRPVDTTPVVTDQPPPPNISETEPSRPAPTPPTTIDETQQARDQEIIEQQQKEEAEREREQQEADAARAAEQQQEAQKLEEQQRADQARAEADARAQQAAEEEAAKARAQEESRASQQSSAPTYSPAPGPGRN
jgi:hypothetical protein